MCFFVLIIACLLHVNRMSHLLSRMRKATNSSDDCSHDASVRSSSLTLVGINLLGNTLQMLLKGIG